VESSQASGGFPSRSCKGNYNTPTKVAIRKKERGSCGCTKSEDRRRGGRLGSQASSHDAEDMSSSRARKERSASAMWHRSAQ